jgi:hypothetical protein
MPKVKSDDRKHRDAMEPRSEGKGERASPGSGEDEDHDEPADLQPDDVENDDTAR